MIHSCVSKLPHPLTTVPGSLAVVSRPTFKICGTWGVAVNHVRSMHCVELIIVVLQCSLLMLSVDVLPSYSSCDARAECWRIVSSLVVR